jgi:hypothetical protein
MRNSILERKLYHNPLFPLSLGCAGCPDFSVCGGLQISAPVFDCDSFCVCKDPTKCRHVCRRDFNTFMNRVREIRGFGFENIPRVNRLDHENLPLVAPVLFNGSSRVGRLRADAVAVKLSDLVNYRNGKLRFSSKSSLAAHFKFEESANIIIAGVDKDKLIEPYWGVIHQSKIIGQLSALKPALVTVPNFSSFPHVPRYDNMHNMKRILICWSELVAAGIPASLHINARTDRDWERHLEFIGEREEVRSIAVEFGTGLARRDRGRWYVNKLLSLAYQVPRELHLALRGGANYLGELSRAFGSVTLLDTASFVRAAKRRRLEWQPGDARVWRRLQMPESEPLDDLLQLNVDRCAAMTAHKIGR